MDTDWKEIPRPEAYQILQKHCIAFWCVEYLNPEAPQNEVDFKVCGGSAFLWQSDCGKFLVTAYHVWAEFKDRLLKNPNSNLIFYLDGDHAFPIAGVKLISEDKELDIAVFGGSGIEKLQLKEKAFFLQSRQPPQEVLSGDRLALLGYPKDLRIEEQPWNTIGILYMQGAAVVSEYGFRIRMSGNQPNKFHSDTMPPLKTLDFPGTSGGPVFVFRNNHIEWIGIVSEGGIAPHYDIVITPSKFISIDGKIIRPPTLL